LIERLPELLKRRLRSRCFDTSKFAWLDTARNSAYTTEFLDGPEKLVEENRSTTSVKRGHALIGILKNMNKGTDKVKAGMDKKRLEYYKKKLLARREELTRTIARTQEEGRTADEDPTVDLADKAANSYTKEFLFGMTNTDRAILNMIDAALKRIQSDAYGVCANCQEELQQKRLEAVPWAKHCIACQEKMEQGLLQ
jgi:DnaK suppressor protein